MRIVSGKTHRLQSWDKYLIFFILILLPISSAGDYGTQLNPTQLCSDINVNTYVGNLTNLSQLEDTNIPSPTDGYVLKWSSATSKWIASSLGSITKWLIDTSNGYLYNDSITVYFNETKLNFTIDDRATGGNSSWNESYADTLYSTIDEPLWSANFTAHNASWSANTYVTSSQCSDGDFVKNITGDTIYCGTPAGSGDITAVNTNGQYLTGGAESGVVNLLLNETVLNATIDSRDSDTTYTNGTGLSLVDTTFSIVLSYFQGLFIELTDSFGGDVSGTYDNLQVSDDSHLHDYQNITNETWIEDSQLPLANLTSPYCGNITGATSNLCTLTDNDTTYTAGNKLYLSGTEFNVNDTEINTSIEAYGYSTTTGTVTSIATTSPLSGGTITTSGTLSITNDGIGDTQLAYNTGQHLTSTSNPTFNNVTVSDCIVGANGASLCFV